MARLGLTHGVPVGEGHVALCAAAVQADTMPVTGGFYLDGPSVTSTLDFDVRIETSAAQTPPLRLNGARLLRDRMALGRAAEHELLKLFALAPVRRGRGRAEESPRIPQVSRTFA